MSSQSSVHTDYDADLGQPAFSTADHVNIYQDVDEFGYTELEWFEATMALAHWESKHPNYLVVTHVTRKVSSPLLLMILSHFLTLLRFLRSPKYNPLWV